MLDRDECSRAPERCQLPFGVPFSVVHPVADPLVAAGDVRAAAGRGGCGARVAGSAGAPRRRVGTTAPWLGRLLRTIGWGDVPVLLPYTITYRVSPSTGSLQQRRGQGNFCGLCSSRDFAVMCHVPLHGPRLMIPSGHRAEVVASMSRERPYAVMRWMSETSRSCNGR